MINHPNNIALRPSCLPEYWEKSYQVGDIGWDLGRPTPVFREWIKSESTSLNICILGAGNGWDAIHLSEKGHKVTAVDFAPSAIKNMSAKARKKRVTIDILHSDIFEINNNYFGKFDVVLEYTCFCAIDPVQRNKYIQLVQNLLKPKGRYVALLFPTDKVPAEGGPPFAVNIDKTLKQYGHSFSVVKREVSPFSVRPRKGREEFVILLKDGK